MRQSQTDAKNMGVYGEIKHGLLRDKKAVRNFFETLDRTQL